jgi:hypothetical protein
VDPADPTRIVVGALEADNGAVDRQGLGYAFRMSLDYGDAPSTYQTLEPDGGPRHLTRRVRLGARVDGEVEGIPDALATGDDTAFVDDEDGVSFDPLVRNQNVNVGIDSSAAAMLDGWIDWGADGVFDDSDRVFDHVAVPRGHSLQPVLVPMDAAPGPTFARVRLSTQGVSSPGGFALDGEVEDHAVTIHSESPGTLAFGLPAFSVSEGQPSAAIAVKRVGGSAGAVSVRLATADGTAIAGTDYTAVSKVVQWADGQVGARTVQVPIVADALDEGDETVKLVLGNLNGTSSASPINATLKIVDDDPLPSLSFSAAKKFVNEYTQAIVHVTLSAPSAREITVALARSGTATPGADFQAPASLTFPPGVTSLTVRFVAKPDGTQDAGEKAVLTLKSPANAVVGATPSCTFTIGENVTR